MLSKFEQNNLTKAWRNEAPTKAAGMYVQLHLGDPGEDCTEQVAAEDERQPIALSSITDGVVTNTETIEWEELAASEKVTHVSVWDAAEAGNPRIYGPLVKPESLVKGEDARFDSEDLTLGLG